MTTSAERMRSRIRLTFVKAKKKKKKKDSNQSILMQKFLHEVYIFSGRRMQRFSMTLKKSHETWSSKVHLVHISK